MQRAAMSRFAPSTAQDPSSHEASTGQGVLNTSLSQPRRDIGAVRYYRCGTFAARRRLDFFTTNGTMIII